MWKESHNGQSFVLLFRECLNHLYPAMHVHVTANGVDFSSMFSGLNVPNMMVERKESIKM